MSNLVSLSEFRKTKAERERKKYVRGPPKIWGVMEHYAIPTERKGIVSGGVLRCPKCGTACLGARPMGRGSRKFWAYKPICGFGCNWSGVMHLRHVFDPSRCPGCAQNPRVVVARD